MRTKEGSRDVSISETLEVCLEGACLTDTRGVERIHVGRLHGRVTRFVTLDCVTGTQPVEG